MRQLFLLIALSSLLSVSSLFAQKQLKGTIKDVLGKGISSVNVSLKDTEGNIISFNRTNEKGGFSISLKNFRNLGIFEIISKYF